MTPKSAEEVARELLGMQPNAIDGVALVGMKQLAQALRAARREALEEAARVVLSWDYDLATTQGVVDAIADEIRALASSDEEKGGG